MEASLGARGFAITATGQKPRVAGRNPLKMRHRYEWRVRLRASQSEGLPLALFPAAEP